MTDGTSENWNAAIAEVGRGLQESIQRIRSALLVVTEHAARDVNAAESSVLIPTASEGKLRFLVSHSRHADALAKLHVAVETSVAGRVYATGQMIAVEDEPPVVQIPGEPPKVYLAYPLMLSDVTLGVATYVNRPGNPPFTRFSKDEMLIAGKYAALEALLVRQYLRQKALASVFVRDLRDAGAEGDSLEEFLALADDDDIGDDLWRETAQRMSSLGESEMLLCARVVDLLQTWFDGELD